MTLFYSRFKVQGSGRWWRLRRDPSTQVAAVLAFVISHTTFLAAQDDETGRCLIKNHSRPFLWKGQTSEARRGWLPFCGEAAT